MPKLYEICPWYKELMSQSYIYNIVKLDCKEIIYDGKQVVTPLINDFSIRLIRSGWLLAGDREYLSNRITCQNYFSPVRFRVTVRWILLFIFYHCFLSLLQYLLFYVEIVNLWTHGN